jgi:HSP20 family protein
MLYRTSLTAPVFGLRREIDRLFDDTFGRSGSNGMSNWSPAVDIREDEKELTFEFELPGIKAENVEITADNGVLTVRGEKQGERNENEGRFHVVERSYGSFTRSFQLPQGLDDDQIEASFENGVLQVRIPKAALPQPRKIQIKGGESGQRTSAGVSAGGHQHTDQPKVSSGRKREESR